MKIDIKIPDVFQSLTDEARYYVYYGGRGSGKCVDPETRIIMFDGSIKKASDIVIGDKVMGPDSTPRTVLETHSGSDNMYRVIQNQAVDYIVNSNHLLVLKKNPSLKNDCGEVMPSGNYRRPNGRYPDYDDITIMPVTEFMETSDRFKNHFHGYKTGLINFPTKKVTIDPYFLGIWLGDGEAACQRVTTMDQEVIDYCKEYAESIGCKISIYDKHQKSCTVGIVKTEGKNNYLLDLLKDYNLLNNKHIPNDYLINNKKIRSELLAGILDADAFVERACAYLTSKSKDFLVQVKYLADGLGFRTSKNITHYQVPLNGKIFDAYKITISGNIDRLPFKIKRRIKGAKSKPNKDFLKTNLKIEPLGIGKYVGFSLDGDHLFLLEDGTILHNSHTIARFLICAALQYPIKILCTRELQNSIVESVHTLLSDIIRMYGLQSWFSIKNASIEACNGSAFIFKGLAHNIDSVKSTEGVDICWVEEADKVCQKSWDILIPTIRKPNSKFIITFNPTHDDDPVYQMFVKIGQPDSITQLVNYHDNPHFPEVLRKEMEHMKATDYEKYLHVWEGELRTVSDAQVFKGKYSIEEFSSEGVDCFYYGMDFGFAKDPTCIVRCFIMGENLYIDREEYGHHVEIPDIIPMIRHIQAGTDSYRWKIKADCARPETISYLANLNYNVVSAKKWAGSVEDGIEYLKSFKKIIVHPKCKHAAEEFRRYTYKIDKRTNEILPIVNDDYNHVIDALRYSIDDLIKHNCTIYDQGIL